MSCKLLQMLVILHKMTAGHRTCNCKDVVFPCTLGRDKLVHGELGHDEQEHDVQEHGQETGLVENGQVEPMTGSDKPENSQTISSHYHSILNNQLILFILIKRLYYNLIKLE